MLIFKKKFLVTVPIIVLYFILSEYQLYAVSDMNFKMRAREHYDRVFLDHKSYEGFTHRFNLWWEKPMDYYYGFAFGPVWAPLRHEKGDQATLYHAGIEGKWFVVVDHPFYLRGALYINAFKTNALEKGMSTLLGGGIEIKKWGVGFAFEWAYQSGYLEESGHFNMISPSIGVHFYDYT